MVEVDRGSQQDSLPRGVVYPIRVIDVEATLANRAGGICFVKPSSWEFYTISHTWTEAIESWSEFIASKSNQEAGKLGYSYNEQLEKVDFSKYRGYRDLMVFLKLLRGDGVKHIWMDTLCINQSSNLQEKNQEIPNMASYYSESLGCYACAHGFGGGWGIWKEEGDTLQLPYWFSRVWTFQELLLPKKLTFVLEISEMEKIRINRFIYTFGKGEFQFCKCTSESAESPNRCTSDSAETSYDPSEAHNKLRYIPTEQLDTYVLSTDVPCSHCGSDALVKRAQANFYFADGEGIISLMQIAGGLGFDSMDARLLRLRNLLKERKGMGCGESWDPVRVVSETSRRNCKWDEDRVLSILGLLGVKGAIQLRAEENRNAVDALDKRLLGLAQHLACSDPTLLVKLCVAQYATSKDARMSWAPCLKGMTAIGEKTTGTTTQPAGKLAYDDGSLALIKNNATRDAGKVMVCHKRATDVVRQIAVTGLLDLSVLMRLFEKKVEVENVSCDGILTLQAAHILKGRFVRVDQYKYLLRCDYDGDFVQGYNDEGEAIHDDEYLNFQFQAYYSQETCLLYRMYAIDEGGFPCVAQSVIRVEEQEAGEVLGQVNLVLLGQARKHSVLMVCVDGERGALRKVGTAWLYGLHFLERPRTLLVHLM